MGEASRQQLHCGDNQWQVSLQGLKGKLGLWGGTRPAPNITAEVLGSGPAKFLPALTPGLWLKNQGTQAGAEHPRGLCKHGRYRQVESLGDHRDLWEQPEPGEGSAHRERGHGVEEVCSSNRDLRGIETKRDREDREMGIERE